MYGGADISMEKALKMGNAYLELYLQRDGDLVEVMLEVSPVMTSDGGSCDSAESYMDAVVRSVPAQLEAIGLQNVQSERFEKEIGGRSYACASVSGGLNGVNVAQYFICTERDGFFLTLVIASDTQAKIEQILAGMLPANP